MDMKHLFVRVAEKIQSKVKAIAVQITYGESKGLREGMDPQTTNAVDHALVSACLTHKGTPAIAKNLGDLNELIDPSSIPSDSWKDQWNNAVGRQIGRFAKENHLGIEAVLPMVLNALGCHKLIQYETDARIDLDYVPAPTLGNPSEKCIKPEDNRRASRR